MPKRYLYILAGVMLLLVGVLAVYAVLLLPPTGYAEAVEEREQVIAAAAADPAPKAPPLPARPAADRPDPVQRVWQRAASDFYSKGMSRSAYFYLRRADSWWSGASSGRVVSLDDAPVPDRLGDLHGATVTTEHARNALLESITVGILSYELEEQERREATLAAEQLADAFPPSAGSGYQPMLLLRAAAMGREEEAAARWDAYLDDQLQKAVRAARQGETLAFQNLLRLVTLLDPLWPIPQADLELLDAHLKGAMLSEADYEALRLRAYEDYRQEAHKADFRMANEPLNFMLDGKVRSAMNGILLPLYRKQVDRMIGALVRRDYEAAGQAQDAVAAMIDRMGGRSNSAPAAAALFSLDHDEPAPPLRARYPWLMSGRQQFNAELFRLRVHVRALLHERRTGSWPRDSADLPDPAEDGLPLRVYCWQAPEAHWMPLGAEGFSLRAYHHGMPSKPYPATIDDLLAEAPTPEAREQFRERLRPFASRPAIIIAVALPEVPYDWRAGGALTVAQYLALRGQVALDSSAAEAPSHAELTALYPLFEEEARFATNQLGWRP